MAYPYDPARAKKLLADAGLANGFPLDVYAFQLPGLPEGKAFAEAVAGYWEKIGIKPKLIPVDYPAFRKNWVDRKTPGAIGYFNIANRDWIGTFALLEKQAYSPSKPNDTANDPEIDGMIAQVMRQTDREKINALMRNIFTRLRSEHLGCPSCTCTRRTRRPRRSASGTRARSCTTSSSTSSPRASRRPGARLPPRVIRFVVVAARCSRWWPWPSCRWSSSSWPGPPATRCT